MLAALALAAAAVPAPIEVVVLGTYHMDNPGRDIANSRVDPVTAPDKQHQLEAVATALARFRPTAVAIERVAADQASLVDQRYARFTPADLARDNDERVQVGYRLARVAGVTRVYAVDEQGDFPFDGVQQWARAHGREAELTTLMDVPVAEAARLTADQKTKTVGQLLRRLNLDARDGGVMSQGNTYYQMLRFGEGSDQPGARLNAAWYGRNAAIFAKLARVARPGDRIVVVYGAGHLYWLRHFVSTMPGYRLVDAETYLPAK